jgi:hypothetical protein
MASIREEKNTTVKREEERGLMAIKWNGYIGE